MTTQTIDINGMSCGGCVKRVEDFLAQQKGVSRAAVDLAKKQATVDFDPQFVTADQLVKGISKLGYQASLKK